jgi:hypothetical protein
MKSEAITCADGLINSPDHFLNFVDSRCVPYTTLQLVLFAGGCLMWVIAYAIIIRNALKHKYVEMAAVAAFSNFAWEFVWSWPFSTDMGWFLVVTYKAWYFLDIFIVYLVFKHGARQYQNASMKKLFPYWGGFFLIVFHILYYYFVKQGMDEPIGANSAYVCQLLLSAMCLQLMLEEPEAKYFSFNVGILRSYGTGANTVFMFLHYPENHVVHTMAVSSFILDNIYLYCLAKKRKAQGLGLFRPL